MTNELLEQANKLSHAISTLENQIQLVEEMHHSDHGLYIRCQDVGGISIADDDELKDDIIDMILNRLNTKKGEVEDEYRRL